MEHHVEAAKVVPAVETAPPLTAPLLADLARRPHVVGHDPTVAAHAVEPHVHVIQHPPLVPLVPGIQIRIGHERRGAERVGNVSVQHDVVEQLDDLVASRRGLLPILLQVLDDRMEGGPHAVVAVAVSLAALQPGDHLLGIGVQEGACAAVDGRADDLVARIVVRRLRVLAHEHGREAPRAVHVLGAGRLGQTKVIEGHVAFALMVPIRNPPPSAAVRRTLAGRQGQAVILVVRLRELPGEKRIPPAATARSRHRVPRADGQVVYAPVGAQRIEEAPIVDPLIEVIYVVGEVDDAAGIGVLRHHHVGRLLHERDELPLQQRPRRRSSNLSSRQRRHVRQRDGVR